MGVRWVGLNTKPLPGDANRPIVRRHRLLVGLGLLLVVGGVVTPVVFPGVQAEVTDDPVRPGPVDVTEMAIEAGEVRGATADLLVRTRLGHDRAPTPNVTVRFRAYDAESGLIAAERTVELGTVDSSRAVNGTLTVEREGGYVLETTVFGDGETISRERREVSGMAALRPPYADSDAAFADRPGVPAVLVSVDSVENNRTTLSLSAAVTNGGDTAAEELRVAFVLRGAASNLVAGRADTIVGSVTPGRTTEATTTVEVPTNVNYFVDVILTRDGVVIDTAQSVANLDPEERISANETVRDVEFDVSEFASQETPAPEDARATETVQTSTPGFTAAVAVIALLTVAGLARWRNE